MAGSPAIFCPIDHKKISRWRYNPVLGTWSVDGTIIRRGEEAITLAHQEATTTFNPFEIRPTSTIPVDALLNTEEQATEVI